jgi:hypothetical protein
VNAPDAPPSAPLPPASAALERPAALGKERLSPPQPARAAHDARSNITIPAPVSTREAYLGVGRLASRTRCSTAVSRAVLGVSFAPQEGRR